MESTVHTVFILSLIIWGILELWVFYRELGQLDNSKDTNTKKKLVISVIIAAILGNYFSTFSSFFIPGTRELHMTIGTILVFAGVIFRFWSIQTLGKFFRTTVMVQKDHTLIQSGPYKYLRHPSYSGILISLTGVGIATGNWISFILMEIIVFWGLSQRIVVEEKELKKVFGEDYTNYIKQTKKLLPYIY